MIELVKSIISYKNLKGFENASQQKMFNPFMINRWSSMHSKELAKMINLGPNKYWTVFKQKKDWLIFYNNAIPKMEWGYFKYIKKQSKTKSKKTKKEENEEILAKKIASSLEISLREAKSYLDRIDSKNLIKTLNLK